MLLEVLLPWPDRALHPNARVHWAQRARATKAARFCAWALTGEAVQKAGLRTVPEGKLHLMLDFYPPDRRRRDDDGLLAAFKAARDGIADALGIDDSRFVSHPCLMDEVVAGGQVRVCVVKKESHI